MPTFGCLCPAVYELQAPGRDGHDKPFHKPWACTTMMFVGAPSAGRPASAFCHQRLWELPAVTSVPWHRHLLP